MGYYNELAIHHLSDIDDMSGVLDLQLTIDEATRLFVRETFGGPHH